MRNNTSSCPVFPLLHHSAGVTILVGVGGGSPIDACKTLSYFHHERHGSFLPHVSGADEEGLEGLATRRGDLEDE